MKNHKSDKKRIAHVTFKIKFVQLGASLNNCIVEGTMNICLWLLMEK